MSKTHDPLAAGRADLRGAVPSSNRDENLDLAAVCPGYEVAGDTFDDELFESVTEPSTVEHLAAIRQHLYGGDVHTSDPRPTVPEVEHVSPDDGVHRLVYVASFFVGVVLGALALLPLVMSLQPPSVSEAPRADVGVVQRFVAEGFASLEADPAVAADRFRSALEADPTDPLAALGYGQAELALGRRAVARDALCRAARAPGTLGTTAIAELAEHGLSCR